MVVRMRWPWPPQLSKKFEVKIVVRKLEEFHQIWGDIDGEKNPMEVPKLSVEIRWKGPKFGLTSFRRSVKRNFTKEEEIRNDDVVEWNEDFQSVCNLSAIKENVFHSWEITFTVLNGLNQGVKDKNPVVGTSSLNLAEYVSAAAEKVIEVSIPLCLSTGNDSHPSLCLSLSLLELRTIQETSEPVQRSIVPAPLSPLAGEVLPTEKDELSALKAGLRKVTILKEYVSTRRAKVYREDEGSDERCSVRSDDGDYVFPFDTSSLDDCDEREMVVEDTSTVRKSFSYGSLAYANCVGGFYISEMKINGENEDGIYYSNHKSYVGCVTAEDSTASVSDQTLLQSSRRKGILSWRKRKLNFRSPKAKGEPLLKKAYGEEGGDDIDYDRRQLSSSDESNPTIRHKADEDSSANRLSVSKFGDDNFAVGTWERKEFVSRDGHMKLWTRVFFASIDQRSERAAGESACTALVAVIANWFQTNRDSMPIKSQFDTLIREGSLEWRNLCGNETYREKFPDKHFDLETVLLAKIRPISIVSDKSFVGFFYPERMEGGGGFEFLQGAMSFDNIWDEICSGNDICFGNGEPRVYIVSWNDHFFILKVEPEAFYIIDTLGERLFEGCDQAYILKFDRDTKICRVPEVVEKSFEENQVIDQRIVATTREISGNQQISFKISEESSGSGKNEEVVCEGKESCKEYIKSFLAAIPIRELQDDVNKGLMASMPIHHRLQIDFHYVHFLEPSPEPATAKC